MSKLDDFLELTKVEKEKGYNAELCDIIINSDAIKIMERMSESDKESYDGLGSTFVILFGSGDAGFICQETVEEITAMIRTKELGV